MGHAKIVSGGEDGSYRVKIDYGKSTKDLRLKSIDARLDALVDLLATALDDVNFSMLDEAQAQADVEAAVEAYAAAASSPPSILKEAVEKAAKAHEDALAILLEKKMKTAPLLLAFEALKNEDAQLKKDRAYWDGLVIEETVQAWCADLTENAAGDVATLEIPGENKLVLISPAAPKPVPEDGELTAREVQTPAQVFFNAAILPGWQKFKPSYRRGTITVVDADANTASVLLDEQDTSSAQNLPINKFNTLVDVPVQYMECNARAFEVGDRCVVRFVDRDWKKPKVVGFVDHPKACPLYLESGQLSFDYPAPESPARFDPAQWHFMDLSTGDDWLGKITATGTQNPSQVLTDGQDSMAIGYPKSTVGTAEEKAAKDAAKKEQYGETTAAKKRIVGLFPASLFSGKMRLFMQAQYGAQETLPEKLTLGLSGTSPTLSYVDNGVGVQIGFWSHASTGILRAPSGAYFLINLALAADGSGTTVTYYPITLFPAATRLAKMYAASDDITRDKIEAYIFSGCTVQTTKGKTIRLMTGAKGRTLAYGWNFSADGSEARVVVHEALNAGLPTVRWKSSTVTVSLTYAKVDGVATVYASAAAVDNGEWIDGWGTYNIFVPDTEIVTAPLSLLSLRVGSPRKGVDFAFSEVEIYGYYVGADWIPVKMSGTDTSTEPVYIHASSGITWDSGYAFPPSADWIAYGYRNASEPASGSLTTLTSWVGMDVSVGGHVTRGISGPCTFNAVDVSPLGGRFDGIAIQGATVYPDPFGWGVPLNGVSPKGFDAAMAWAATGITRYRRAYISCQYTTTGGSGQFASTWALVIPGGDCCAAYVATYEVTDLTTVTRSASTGNINTGGIALQSSDLVTPTWDITGPFFDVWTSVYMPQPGVMATDHPVLLLDAGYNIYCYNSVLNGATGTPGGSYYGLFNVSYLYPFYDRGMYTYTSHGKRYVMSEGLMSPASAYYNRRFVGWA